MFGWFLFFVVGFWILFFGICKALEYGLGGGLFSNFLSRRGIEVSFYSVTWYTLSFNSWIGRMGRRFARFWQIWFSVGLFFSVIGMFASVLFLLVNLFWLVTEPASSPPVMSPVVPGVNVPSHDLVFYFFTLFVAAVVHELGHAFAALSHTCGLEGMGFGLFVVFPVAFTDIRSHDLEWSSAYTKMKIFCAGPWHNFCLCMLALFLMICVPSLCSPLFIRTDGMYVVNSNVEGVKAGNIILSINSHPVLGEDSWRQAYLDVVSQSMQSFCVSGRLLDKGSKTHDCCEEDYDGGLQCFHRKTSMYCLPASRVIKEGYPCNSTLSCERDGDECVDASLSMDERIMWIELNDGSLSVVSGSPSWLWSNIEATPKRPRFLSSVLGGIDLKLRTLFMYLFSLSAALGIFNLLPIFHFDGSHTLDAMWVSYGGMREDEILTYIKAGTSCLLAINLVLSSKSILF